jgi:hypothetical protein
VIQYKLGIRAWFLDTNNSKVLFQGSDGQENVSLEAIIVGFKTGIEEVVDNSYNRDAVVRLLREVSGEVYGEGDMSGELVVGDEVEIDEVEVEA